jgi:hypothetical protein
MNDAMEAGYEVYAWDPDFPAGHDCFESFLESEIKALKKALKVAMKMKKDPTT